MTSRHPLAPQAAAAQAQADAEFAAAATALNQTTTQDPLESEFVSKFALKTPLRPAAGAKKTGSMVKGPSVPVVGGKKGVSATPEGDGNGNNRPLRRKMSLQFGEFDDPASPDRQASMQQEASGGANASLIKEIAQVKDTIDSRRKTLKSKFSEEALNNYLADSIKKLAGLEAQLAAATQASN
jgi:hypothetical protein